MHKWGPIQFALVADDFGIKYVGKDNLQHVTSILQEHYEITINSDCDTSEFISIRIANNVKYTLQCQNT
ncbi:LOW QUALITY PROTEIN: hypothetical protein ACHAW6_000114 [Cyclotella cf. meneghiniana]